MREVRLPRANGTARKVDGDGEVKRDESGVVGGGGDVCGKAGGSDGGLSERAAGGQMGMLT